MFKCGWYLLVNKSVKSYKVLFSILVRVFNFDIKVFFREIVLVLKFVCIDIGVILKRKNKIK